MTPADAWIVADPCACPICGRDACEDHLPGAIAAPDEAAVAACAETYQAFRARMATRTYPPDLIPCLVPSIGITMLHGQPRSLKTWVELELARALSLGDAAFGLEAFRVPEPRRVWYLTEEDPELEIDNRFACLFAGRHPGTVPTDTLHLSVQKSISLDDLTWQNRTIAYACEHRIEATFLDPIRSLSDAVDQGPDKLRPLALFLRRYMRETGSTVLLNHHDTKPMAGKPDDRAKPQRASGGGIFSIADSPIHAERLGSESKAILTPSHYKFSMAPEPFVIALTADDPKRPTWVRLDAETTSASGAADLALHDRLLAYLRDHPNTSGSQLAKGLHISKDQTLEALGRLRQNGLADFFQRGQAHLWSVPSTQEQV